MAANLTRREFIKNTAALLLLIKWKPPLYINSVNGKIPVTALGKTLIHEHFLVDFIGADKTNSNRWNKDDVVQKLLPYLNEVKKFGVQTIFDCTPAFLGRDVILLKQIADASGIQVITNTGYYGASGNKFLPQQAFEETDAQLAKKWITEYTNGIDGTGIKPGFIKIGVDGPHLSDLHKKLVSAAGITHLQTGLTICSHTGPASAAFEELEILQRMKVQPAAFVWVHAQNETDLNMHVKAARSGAWVSLDGIGWGDFDNYARALLNLKETNLLGKTLISHDAGWYKPGETLGGDFTGYTNIFIKLLPLLKKKGFSEADINQLLVKNPAEAFAIQVRKISAANRQS